MRRARSKPITAALWWFFASALARTSSIEAFFPRASSPSSSPPPIRTTRHHRIDHDRRRPNNHRHKHARGQHSPDLHLSADSSSSSSMVAAFDAAVQSRYACTRFRRHAEQRGSGLPEEEKKKTETTKLGSNDDEEDKEEQQTPQPEATQPSASVSDPTIVRQSVHCLNLARRAPSGFNSQPYRVVLVSSPAAKEALAANCIGRNADRVRDSDCTAVFLADREWGRDWRKFGAFLAATSSDNEESGASSSNSSSSSGGSRSRRRRRYMSKGMRRKVQALVLLFSSGLPLPRILAVPVTFVVRSVAGLVASITRRRYLIPTLSGAETWSTKNTMLVAMSYMLAATARGVATCPMEGYWASGVRRALGVPRRFAVPLIVCAGTSYHGDGGGGIAATTSSGDDEEQADDMGMDHGGGLATPRYPMEEVVFGDSFGRVALLPP